MELRHITDHYQRQAYYFMVFQVGIALVFGLIIWLVWGFRSGASVWVGGLTCAIPHLYFAHRFFTATGALAAKQIVRGMYRAEIVKLLLTVFLIVIVFKTLPVDVLAFFIGFILAQITAFVMIQRFFRNTRSVE
ncbi:MAG: ATP synthase subunit I [Gammaproteobacteria bacterium]|nr:ATP synthase subunit I [Gammaproteobacteria bacterium]